MPKLVFVRPSVMTTPTPWIATDAPMIEKISAWLDDVGDVLAAVERGLDELVDVLPLDDLDRVRLVGEELAHRVAEDLVSFVLEGVQLDPVLLEVLQTLEIPHHLYHLRGRRHERLGLPYRRGPDGAHLVQLHQLAHVVRDVGHVVDARGEADDVLT